jgi:hypothetical protein
MRPATPFEAVARSHNILDVAEVVAFLEDADSSTGASR